MMSIWRRFDSEFTFECLSKDHNERKLECNWNTNTNLRYQRDDYIHNEVLCYIVKDVYKIPVPRP